MILGEVYHWPSIFALSLYVPLFQLHNRQKVISIGTNRILDYSLLLTLPTVVFMVLILPLFWFFPKAYRMQGAYLLNVGVMLLITIFFNHRIRAQIQHKFVLLIRLVFDRRLRIKFKAIFPWDSALVKRSYQLGFNAFLSEYMAILMTRVDVLLLKYFGSFADLGVYMLAINFIDIINVTGNMIGVVLLNKFAALRDDRASLEILRKVFVLMISFNTLCILGMALLGRPVITFMYKDDYIGAYKAFMYLIPAIFGLTLGSLFNTFLWSKGFPVFTIIAPAATTLIKAIFAAILIPRFGYFGAALSSSLAYPLWLIMLLIWYFNTHKEQNIKDLIVKKTDFAALITMLKSLTNKVGVSA